MACNINSGYTLGCRDSVGGVQFVAIAEYDSSTSYSIGASASITNISPTASFYKFEQYTEQAVSNQEGSFDNNNGTTFFTQTVTIILEDMDTTTRDQFLALTQARVRIIVKTNDGKYFLIGKENGARSSAASAGPGQALGDLQGFSITFEAKEAEPAQEIESTYAESIITS